MEYDVITENGVRYIAFRRLMDIPYIKHGFSTRLGGISEGIYSSLNLGLKTGDEPDNVKENIKRFASAVGVNHENLVISDQVHGDAIKIVNNEDGGKGYSKQKDYSGIDGLVTDIPNIPLMATFADCVPIFFADVVKRVIGIGHAGWKGTELKIGKKIVQTMADAYGSRADEIIAVIGPSISKCCYQVDSVIAEQFGENFQNASTFIFSEGKSRYRLNLWEANRVVLDEAGILNKNIIISNLCTSCNLDLFYSHRRENGNTGRMGAIIQLI